MDWQTLSKPDLPHRLLMWVEANQRHLLWILVASVLFFGGLFSLSLWRDKGGKEAQIAYYRNSKANNRFETLLKDYPKSDAALLALTELGQRAYRENDIPQCLKQYESLYQKAGRQTFYRILALHGMAECHRLQKDYQKAAATFERASKEPGHVAPFVSRFEQARSLQLAGDSQAKTIFEELYRQKRIDPDLKNRVEEQLLWYSLREES